MLVGMNIVGVFYVSFKLKKNVEGFQNSDEVHLASFSVDVWMVRKQRWEGLMPVQDLLEISAPQIVSSMDREVVYHVWQKYGESYPVEI